MKKQFAVILILLVLLSAIFVSCDSDVSCFEMLNRVLNSESITVKCNGDTIFMKDKDTIYWRYVYDYGYDEYYFEKNSTGSGYVYCKEYGESWVKEPMSDSDYSEYVKMISDSYGIDEYAHTLLKYVYNNFDTVMVLNEDEYIMATTAFDIVENLKMSNSKSTLYASFNLYSTYYRVEFFSIDNTDVDVPDSVLKAPVESISLP